MNAIEPRKSYRIVLDFCKEMQYQVNHNQKPRGIKENIRYMFGEAQNLRSTGRQVFVNPNLATQPVRTSPFVCIRFCTDSHRNGSVIRLNTP